MEPGGSASGNEAGQESSKRKDGGYAREYGWVEWTDTINEAGHKACQRICRGHSCCEAGEGGSHAVAYDEAENLIPAGPDSDSDADFSCALSGPVGDYSIDSDEGQEQGNASEYREQDRVDSAVRD